MAKLSGSINSKVQLSVRSVNEVANKLQAIGEYPYLTQKLHKLVQSAISKDSSTVEMFFEEWRSARVLTGEKFNEIHPE